jgi:hypothetical protein
MNGNMEVSLDFARDLVDNYICGLGSTESQQVLGLRYPEILEDEKIVAFALAPYLFDSVAVKITEEDLEPALRASQGGDEAAQEAIQQVLTDLVESAREDK